MFMIMYNYLSFYFRSVTLTATTDKIADVNRKLLHRPNVCANLYKFYRCACLHFVSLYVIPLTLNVWRNLMKLTVITGKKNLFGYSVYLLAFDKVEW